jgi:hypothetical protein
VKRFGRAAVKGALWLGLSLALCALSLVGAALVESALNG